ECAMYASLWADAGLPAGLLHVVQGDREVATAMVDQRAVSAVLFTGSYRAVRRCRADWRIDRRCCWRWRWARFAPRGWARCRRSIILSSRSTSRKCIRLCATSLRMCGARTSRTR
ncbi:MAG: aldehyde dehydrogenase family protein, partial [Chloroflexaceae bacterium]|nr:aldehyde dehydrogenase family protein [Chloroflexaceae bacterium]